MQRYLGISEATFYRLLKLGKFDRFELLPRLGPRRFSGVLVARYLACEANASRFTALAGGKKKTA
jgi:hypothetical protein